MAGQLSTTAPGRAIATPTANVWDQFSDPVDHSWDSISDPAPANETALDRMKLSDPGNYDPSNSEYQAKFGPTSGMSAGDKFFAGVGKAFSDVGTGVQQLGAGIADFVSPRQQTLSDLVTAGGKSRDVSRVAHLRAAVAENRRLEAPLMQSGWAKAGNLAGNVALTLPTVAIPGANTVTGAGVIGAGLGLLQPSTSTKETLLNTGIGGVVGAASQYVGNKIAGSLANRATGKQAAAAAEQEANSVRDSVLAESRQAGYTVPPTAIKPNATNTALESISGKAATRQLMSTKNAQVTNRLVAEDLGLDAAKPITREALMGVRQEAGSVYKAVRGLGQVASDDAYSQAIGDLAQTTAGLEKAYPGIGSQANQQIKQLSEALAQPSHDANNLVSLSRVLRNRASSNFKAAFGAGGNPEKLELAQAQSKAVNAIEDLIQRHLGSSGNAELGNAWDAARTTIAKSYQAEAALKGGNISAIKLAQQLQKGRPVSGGMGTAARFADMFGDVAKLPKSGAGVSKLAATLNTAGIGTALLTGNIPAAAGLLTAGTAPYVVRNALVSGAGQAALATPRYGPNLLFNQAGQFMAKYGRIPATALAIEGGQ